MNTEFQQLQEKVQEVALVVQKLRAENTELRASLVESQEENKTLAQRIEIVSSKITQLIQRSQS